jgi:tetratricopeptide (TPR) repeat protein
MLLRQLNPASAPKEEDFTRDRPPVKVEAMESYVRGLMTANAEQKMKLFSQAVRIDEHFSQPNFQLGKMLFAKKEYRTAGQWLSKVTKSDSHFLEAGFLRAICRYYDGDFNGAAEQFRQVAAEIPLNEVYNNLGAALSRKNDAAALENFSKALEGDGAVFVSYGEVSGGAGSGSGRSGSDDVFGALYSDGWTSCGRCADRGPGAD